MTANATVLVVDDEQLVRWALLERLRAEGYAVLEAANGRDGLERVREGVDLVLLDCELHDIDGAAMLRRIRDHDPDLAVLLAADPTAEMTAEARANGAYRFVNRPFDLDDVMRTVSQALETARLRRDVRMLRASQAQPYGFDRIVGESPPMIALKQQLRRAAAGPATRVLLTGESGTGKHLAANVLHFNSDRGTGPLVRITCSALPEARLELELFGSERSGVTDGHPTRGLLESADGGTIFLDEIGDMVPTLQAKLRRLLEERCFRRVGGSRDISVDLRVIAATTRPLKDQVKAGRFREDLYRHLGEVAIDLPSLRAHPEDVPSLVGFYVGTGLIAIERGLREFYKSRNDPADQQRLARAISVLQDTYRHYVFPTMKVTWGTYPDNRGHVTSNGCFRCHDDSHLAGDGSTISGECEYCHAQSETSS
jgi:two-component system, NtrC family, response regulator AtoC